MIDVSADKNRISVSIRFARAHYCLRTGKPARPSCGGRGDPEPVRVVAPPVRTPAAGLGADLVPVGRRRPLVIIIGPVGPRREGLRHPQAALGVPIQAGFGPAAALAGHHAIARLALGAAADHRRDGPRHGRDLIARLRIDPGELFDRRVAPLPEGIAARRAQGARAVPDPSTRGHPPC